MLAAVSSAGNSSFQACERGGLWRQALALLKMLGDGADARALCSAISACEKGRRGWTDQPEIGRLKVRMTK